MWQGEQAAAQLARTLLVSRIATEEDWPVSKQNPFDFVKRGLDGWLARNHNKEIQEQFFLDVILSTSLDRYAPRDGNNARDASEMFLTVEPESAGYLVLGPTLRLLEANHTRLPATFLHLFLGALSRWVRVYDYRDALNRIERLREWHESDAEDADIELPDVDRSIPISVRRRPLCGKALELLLPTINDALAKRLMESAIELDRVSSRAGRPNVEEEIRESLIDCGEPVPAVVAVFEQHDAIEGSFDEESQGMLELTPEPNLIVPFNGELEDGVLNAFAVLATVCKTLSCASKLIRLMPGNAPSPRQETST